MELSFTEYNVLDKQNTNNNLIEKNNNYDEPVDDNKYKTYFDNLIQPSFNKQIPNNGYKNNISIKPIIRNNMHLVNNSEKRKKKISYDDILSSMNTVVIDGKLEFISKDKLNNILENNNQNQVNPIKKKVTFNQPQVQQPQVPQVNKNSYIYNKFFKDYKEPNQNQNEIPQRPLTKKELLKQIIINRINAINERNRIAEIKSTKLLFNNNNNRNIIINSMQNPGALNHLFKFK
jgi:hypothetical protein